MIFNSVEISNFRNIKYAYFEPDSEMTVFFGSNAQGKTALLEALWCFTGAKSFRGSKDSDLIRFGEEKSSVSLKFTDDDRNEECTVFIEKSRRAVLNGVDYPSASGLAGKICAIIFSPADIDIIEGGPNCRRKFIDTAICELYPAYIPVYRRYMRALGQRNKILKELKFNPMLQEFIEDFEKELAECGIFISDYREKYIDSLKKYVPKIYNGISDGKEKLNLEYIRSAGKSVDEYKEALKNCRRNDMQTLVTSIGPQKDDIDIKINGKSARNFGSQGQKRTAALTLKLSESGVISNITGKKPVALLDDVMSELDPFRQNYILNHISGWQVFITCCDPSNIKGLEKGRVIEVKNGVLL